MENTNLALELPKVAENLSNGEALYGRPAQVNTEEWFNTALHWFAAKGQEIMGFMRKTLRLVKRHKLRVMRILKSGKNNIQVMINIFLWIINFLRLV